MMHIKEFLKETAYIDYIEIMPGELCKVYKSKYDDSYVGHVGLEDDLKFLADREITQELTHGVGFSPKENKWFGWSHRAIYGFQIGSTCKKGDAHYTANTPELLIDDHAMFYVDINEEKYEEARAECQVLPDRSGIRVLHTPTIIPVADSVGDLMSYIDLDDPSNPDTEDITPGFHIVKCGKGEWIAETMEDAKRMAIDFNEGVS